MRTICLLAALIVLATGAARAVVDGGTTEPLTTPMVLGTWGMLWAGQALHLFQLTAKLEDIGNGPKAAWAWIRAHPFTIFREIVSGIIAYSVLAAIPGQLTALSALGAGYMAGDFALRAATRSESKPAGDPKS